MKLTKVQDQAIQARMALIVGAETFDRLFAGIRFDETDGPLLYVYVGSEKIAAEIEDNYSLHIAITVTNHQPGGRTSRRNAESASVRAAGTLSA